MQRRNGDTEVENGLVDTGEGEDDLRKHHWHGYTTECRTCGKLPCKAGSSIRYSMRPRELRWREWWRLQREGMHTHTHTHMIMTGLSCCTAEINNYPPIKKKLEHCKRLEQSLEKRIYKWILNNKKVLNVMIHWGKFTENNDWVSLHTFQDDNKENYRFWWAASTLRHCDKL